MKSATEFIIRQELRPCIVKYPGETQGERALFHGITRSDLLLNPSPMVGGHNGGVVARTVAVVEIENGKICFVDPTNIVFCDSKALFSQYSFYREDNTDE